MPAQTAKPFHDTDRIVDYLIGGYWQDRGPRIHELNVSAGDVIPVHFDLGKARTIDAREALSVWTNVSDIRFREVRDPEDALFRFTGEPGGSYAGHRYKEGVLSHVKINISSSLSYSQEKRHEVIIHEIGHALGLGHSGDYNNDGNFRDDAGFSNDSVEYTIMSYFTPETNPNSTASLINAITPQIADIAAVHRLYGSPDIAMGDDVYGRGATRDGKGMDLTGTGFTTLVDSGGSDTIDLRDYDVRQVISLEPGTRSDLNGFRQNLSIAEGTEIETLLLGAGNDKVIGSSGDDYIDGGAGVDNIDGGAGMDTVHLDADRDGFRILIREDGSLGALGGPGSYDVLRNVEILEFTDGDEDMNLWPWSPEVTPGMVRDVAVLFASSFDRLPAADGLHYWVGRLADGMSMKDIAKAFHAVRVAEMGFDDTVATRNFVIDAYRDVLGRTPDLAGRFYWTRQIDSGEVEREAFVEYLINGVNPSSIGDRGYLEGIGELAGAYAMRHGIWDNIETEKPVEVFGSQATADLRGAMAEVDRIALRVDKEKLGPIVLVDEFRNESYDFG